MRRLYPATPVMDAYRSGDPYLAFAKQARAAPQDATKATHKVSPSPFKSTVLARNTGWGRNISLRIGQPTIVARELLRVHRETYRMFWRMVRWAVDYAMLMGLQTVFGWRVQVGAVSNDVLA